MYLLGLFIEFCNQSLYVMISLCKDAKYYKYLDNLLYVYKDNFFQCIPEFIIYA